MRSQTVEKYTIDSYLNGTALVDGEAVSSFYSYRFLGLNPANGIPVFNDYADRDAFTGRPGIGRYCSDDYGKKRATGSDFYR